MKAALLPIAAVVALLISACGPNQGIKVSQLAKTQDVKVITTPSGAIAYNDLGSACVTPCNLPVSRTDGGSIWVAREGYRTERHFVGTEVVPVRVADKPDLHPSFRDPESEAAAAALFTVAGLDRTKKLGVNRLEVTMTRLAEGEKDPLGPDVPIAGDLFSSYLPVTGERIPIDISEDESEEH